MAELPGSKSAPPRSTPPPPPGARAGNGHCRPPDGDLGPILRGAPLPSAKTNPPAARLPDGQPLAQHRPGFESRAQFKQNACTAATPQKRKAKLEMRSEPLRQKRQAVLGQVLQHFFQIHPQKVGNIKRSCSSVPKRRRGPARGASRAVPTSHATVTSASNSGADEGPSLEP